MRGIEYRREDAWNDKSVDGGSCCGRGCQGVSQNLNDGSEGRSVGFYTQGERDIGDWIC